MDGNKEAQPYPELSIYGTADGGAIVIERREPGDVFEYQNNVAVYHLTPEQYKALWDLNGILNAARGSDASYQEWHEDRAAMVTNVTDTQALAGYGG